MSLYYASEYNLKTKKKLEHHKRGGIWKFSDIEENRFIFYTEVPTHVLKNPKISIILLSISIADIASNKFRKKSTDA